MGFLDAYQGHAAIAAHANTLVGWATVMQGGFIVNLDGIRFGDESAGYSEYAAILSKQENSTGWLIIDRDIHDGSMSFKEFEVTVNSGAIVWADSVDELASKIGVPSSSLEMEVANATAVFEKTTEDRFGRKTFEKVLKAPFGAIKLRPSLFHTQGGLVVNGVGAVIDKQSKPISGLYAAGGAAIGISGHGSDGYLAGNGLLAAFGFAYLAAKEIAAKSQN
jgi:fumarate reductase flavoprotein subunit